MLKYGGFLLAVLLGLGQASLAVEELSVIYNGEPQLARRIAMGFWGYRPVVEGEIHPFQPIRLVPNRKLYALKVLTLGRYSGVRFDFVEPLDLSAFQQEKNVFLEVYLRAPLQPTLALPAPEETAGVAGVTAARGAAPAPGLNPPMYGDRPFGDRGVTLPPGVPGLEDDPDGQFPLRQPGGRLDRMERPPDGPGDVIEDPMRPVRQPLRQPTRTPDEAFPDEFKRAVQSDPTTVPLPRMKNLRLTFFTEQGEGLLILTPEDFYPRDEVNKTWVRLGIPLSLLKKELPVGGKLTRLVISSDEPAELLIGRMAFVRDTDPIQLRLFINPPFLEAKKSIFLAARIEGGLTPYEVTWDFDTAAGASVDATGERVTYTYAKEGVYTITCTARDKTGGKPPTVSSIEVKISRPFEE